MKQSARVRDLEMMLDLTLSVMVRYLDKPAIVVEFLEARAAEAHTAEESEQYLKLAREIAGRIYTHIEIKREVHAICADARITREVIHG